MSGASTRPWLVACGRSITSDSSHYGFGTLWMRYDRRGDFARSWAQMLEATGFSGELDWWTLRRGPSARMARMATEKFFATRWIAFHSLVIERDLVDLGCHGGDEDLGQRKHMTMLLTNKIKRAMRKHGAGQEFKVWTAPIDSYYAKADEAVQVVAGNVVAKLTYGKPHIRVSTRPRASAPVIQLCELLLNTVTSAWVERGPKRVHEGLQHGVADHLGWPDLRADTYTTARKFNVWKFHDPAKEPMRSAETRKTKVG